MNLYKIDGGIGKNIAFTALIQELVEKDGGEICIETAYPEVYINITGVVRIYNSNEASYYRINDTKYSILAPNK